MRVSGPAVTGEGGLQRGREIHESPPKPSLGRMESFGDEGLEGTMEASLATSKRCFLPSLSYKFFRKAVSCEYRLKRNKQTKQNKNPLQTKAHNHVP